MNPGLIHSAHLRALCATFLSLCLVGCGGSDDDGRDIPQPEVLASSGGVLQVTLRQAPSTIVVAGKTFTSNVFNGQYVAPVLKLSRGDRMELTLQNRIGAADNQIDAPLESNLHYHGMSVTPIAPGDDVFLHVAAGADYLYQWTVPALHPQGTHWYHPHAHGLVETEILSGMSGLLIVDGLVAQHFPAFATLPEKYFLLKDIDLPGAADGSPKTKTINGVLGGNLRLAPGEMQVWNIGNVGADAYFDLAIDGLRMWEINRDGNIQARPIEKTSLFLPPGSRSVVLVLAPSMPGAYDVRTRAVDTGPQGDPNPEVRLAKLLVAGAPMDTPALQARLADPAVDRDTATPEQIAALPITRRRTVTFSESDDGNTFYIDGREYDVARDDITVQLGDVEEWTILNVTGERHVFHIHQMDFLVKSINNQDADETGLRDVVDLPYAQNGVPGAVTVVIPFTDPVMVGRFVFHCHIVEHEDGGMMANVVVVPPGGTAMAPAKMHTLTAAESKYRAAWGWQESVPLAWRAPVQGVLARLTGGRSVPDPASWNAPICRNDGDLSARSQSSKRATALGGSRVALAR